MSFFPPVKTHIIVHAVDIDTAKKFFHATSNSEVSPELHFYDNPHALRIRCECLAKLKCLQNIEAELAKNDELQKVFKDKNWVLDTSVFVMDVPTQ
jgi:hypothetical protein